MPADVVSPGTLVVKVAAATEFESALCEAFVAFHMLKSPVERCGAPGKASWDARGEPGRLPGWLKMPSAVERIWGSRGEGPSLQLGVSGCRAAASAGVDPMGQHMRDSRRLDIIESVRGGKCHILFSIVLLDLGTAD